MNLRFWRKIQLTDDLTAMNRLTICIAEFFGTAILMFVGCMGCAHYSSEMPRPLIQGAFSFGLAVTMAIQSVGHISGAHVNPIITLGAFIVGCLPAIEVPVYFIGQFSGSFAGFGLVKLLLPETYIFGTFNSEDGICAVGLNPKLTPMQGFGIEAVISFILVTIGCAVWDYRNMFRSETVSIRFGFAVAVIVLAAGPFTAAHMNPARTLGPLVLNGYWKHHWIFWAGPLTGCIIASCLYSIIFD